MHGAYKNPVGSKSHGRSRVSNGNKLFVSADGRSPWARRYRDLVQCFAQDADGAENLTELKLSLIRRAASLAVEYERLEGMLAEGQANVDVDFLRE